MDCKKGAEVKRLWNALKGDKAAETNTGRWDVPWANNAICKQSKVKRPVRHTAGRRWNSCSRTDGPGVERKQRVCVDLYQTAQDLINIDKI